MDNPDASKSKLLADLSNITDHNNFEDMEHKWNLIKSYYYC